MTNLLGFKKVSCPHALNDGIAKQLHPRHFLEAPWPMASFDAWGFTSDTPAIA